MKGMSRPTISKLHLLASTLLTGWLTVPVLAQDQSAPPIRVGGSVIRGIPEDWSHRYVVFSDPGTEEEAIRSGRHAEWQKIVNEPRYVIHQIRRNARVQGPAAADVEVRSKWISEHAGPRPSPEAPDESEPPQDFGAHPSRRRGPPSPIREDWSVSLNGPGLAAGHYPAKYSLDTNTASCRDFVVFPTGAAGSGGGTSPTPAAGQATIVAFDNLYAGGGCGSTNPTVYWAYNIVDSSGNGMTANLSPVLSLDGQQVTFIATFSGTSYLVIVRMAPCTGCSVSSPLRLTPVGAGAFRTCAIPCATLVSLGNLDTNSAPFYRYDSSDTLYVGNDIGQLNRITGVFSGTPAINPPDVTGWPVNLPGGQRVMNSPVYDSGSGLVFVTGAGGFLSSKQANINNGVVAQSSQLDCSSTGFTGPPLLDSSQGQIYTFVGYGCDSTTVHNSYINRFPTGTSINGNYGAPFSYQNTATNTTTTVGRLGAFDSTYLTGPGNTGRLYTCVNGVMYQAPVSTLVGTGTGGGPNNGVVQSFGSAIVNAVNSTSTCSPVTEFLGASGVDRLFVSVQANGNALSCNTSPGGCLYNYIITTGPPTGPNAGVPVSGGTSGIVLDNRSTALSGTQQIYFNTLSGNTAIQASQSTLH